MGGSAAAQCGRSHARRKDEWRERVGAGVGFAAAAVGRLWRQHYLAVAKPGRQPGSARSSGSSQHCDLALVR